MKGFFITVFCLVSLQLFAQKVVEPERRQLKIEEMYSVDAPRNKKGIKVLVGKNGESCIVNWNFMEKRIEVDSYNSSGQKVANFILKSPAFQFIDWFETDSSFVFYSSINPKITDRSQLWIFEMGKESAEIKRMQPVFFVRNPKEFVVGEWIQNSRLFAVVANKRSGLIGVKAVDKFGGLEEWTTEENKEIAKSLIGLSFHNMNSGLESGFNGNKVVLDSSEVMICNNNRLIRLNLSNRTSKENTLPTYNLDSHQLFFEGYWFNVTKGRKSIRIEIYDKVTNLIHSKTYIIQELFNELDGLYDFGAKTTTKVSKFLKDDNLGFVLKKENGKIKMLLGSFVELVHTSGGGYVPGVGMGPVRTTHTGELKSLSAVELTLAENWEIEFISRYPKSWELEAELMGAQTKPSEGILVSNKVFDDYFMHSKNNKAHMYKINKKTISIFSATLE